MVVPKRALVCGGGGFIGHHLVRRLKQEGLWVRAIALERPLYSASGADDFRVGDLSDPAVCRGAFDMDFDEVYQLAADMGGAGYVFTGDHDADLMRHSALVNLNILEACCRRPVGRLFFSSSACIYPARNQMEADHPLCEESSAYPAEPDSEYGWEKLFSERLYLAHHRNRGLPVRLGRYHNVFGPEGAWTGGREKAPAAICRKVAEARNGDAITLWGDGRQTRSFLFIDDCIEATVRLTRSAFVGPVNIGSEEMVTIDALVDQVAAIAGKKITKNYQPGPVGVRGRNSDNRLIRDHLGWSPTTTLQDGLRATYAWIAREVEKAARPSV